MTSTTTSPSSMESSGSNEKKTTGLVVLEEDDDYDNTKQQDPAPSLPPPPSQFSQTDVELLVLEERGELMNIIGSQSLLSQELTQLSQDEDDEETNVNHEAMFEQQQDKDDNDDDVDVTPLQEDQVAFSLSQSSLPEVPMSTSSNDTAKTATTATMELDETAKAAAALLQQQQAGEEETSTTTTTTTTKEAVGSSTPKTNNHTTIPKSDEPQKLRRSLRLSPKQRQQQQRPPLRDTPLRTSRCFGSLLSAVELVTTTSTTTSSPNKAAKRKLNLLDPPGRKKTNTGALADAMIAQKQRATLLKHQKYQAKIPNFDLAQKAAALAVQAQQDPTVRKRILLQMALARKNPRAPPTQLPPAGHVVPPGFVWAHYPPLEAVLKHFMEMYFELSFHRCQSAEQQGFNKELAAVIRTKAHQDFGWSFAPSVTDRQLRDRIRCYYKTHLQNSKKRWTTMLKNPTKKANAKHLCDVWNLLQEATTTATTTTAAQEKKDKADA